jgi:membrane protease YdiL (CAAX protease family)
MRPGPKESIFVTLSVRAVPRALPSPLRRLIVAYPLTAYFLFAFLGTWAFLVPLILGHNENGLGLLPYTLPDAALAALFILPTLGPVGAALLVIAAEQGRAGLRPFVRRFGQWRVRPVWYLIAIAGPLCIWVVGFTPVLGGTPIGNLIAQGPLVLSTFRALRLLGLLIPAIGEEPGWRGFALPRLQARYGPVWGTLILGTLHGLWHLPSFFTPFAGPISLVGFVGFVLAALAGAFFFTWVYNHTGGSILLAMVVHSAYNAASGVLNLDAILPHAQLATSAFANFGDGTWLNAIAFGTAALLLIVGTRGRLGARSAGAEAPPVAAAG